MEDKLITCPKCGGDAAYETKITKDITNWSCYGCGFLTNSKMKEGEDFWKEQFEIMPELHKDLIFEDKGGHYWIPSTVNMEETGMVFANGGSKNDWTWSAVKATSIPKKEQKNFPIPGEEGKFYKKKMNMKTLKEFPSNKGFIDALDYIGVFGADKE